MTSQFLPITKAEAAARGWDQLDFVYIIGDAYVDHPSFGAAIISRVIEALGFSIASSPSRSPTGTTWNLARPNTPFWSPAATLTRWSPTTPLPSASAATTPTPPAARRAAVPTAPPSSIPASCGSCIRTPHRHRRAGGLAATLCPLRLLGRRGAPLHPCRRAGRPAAVRHG